MAFVGKQPKDYDSSWIYYTILGVNLGLLPVFTSLVVFRLFF